MVLSVVLNPRFNFLNSNSFRNKADFRTRERRALVDITIPVGQSYTTGGYPIDFSVIRGFTQVYAGIVISDTEQFARFRIEPATDNAASGAKVSGISINTGNEFSVGPGLIIANGVTAEIIGI